MINHLREILELSLVTVLFVRVKRYVQYYREQTN